MMFLVSTHASFVTDKMAMFGTEKYNKDGRMPGAHHLVVRGAGGEEGNAVSASGILPPPEEDGGGISSRITAGGRGRAGGEMVGGSQVVGERPDMDRLRAARLGLWYIDVDRSVSSD